MDKASCPPPEQLEQFLLGQLPEPQAEGLGQHLSQCDPCLRTVEGLRVDDTLLEELHKGVGVARQAAQAVQQGLMERVQALAPSSKPPDLKDAPTPPPDNQWACQPTPGPVARVGLPALPVGSFKFLAPAQAPDEIGRLGAYRVLEVLGKGGMGVVFRAEDARLGRPVALKAMLPEVAQEPDARERFLREARAVAALEHENIIAIHQVDEDRGIPYIVMPLLKGMSLEDRLKAKQPGADGTPLELAQILKIGREIATGLAAAHARGLIHRDIKPGNIWLDATAGDRVKLLDFGLARSTSGDQKLTQSGCILGTPAYMAPEQAQAHKVDSRADLFSLGVVLYQLCTGQLPFHGPDMYSMLMALATHEPPPPQALNPGLPGRLSDLVMKLLPKDPTRRLGSAQEAVKELLAIEKDLAPAPPAADVPVAETPAAAPQPGVAAPARVPLDRTKVAAPTRRRRRRWPVVAACVALVVVLLGIYLAPTIIRVDTDEGTLVIDVNDPDVLVTVKQNNVKLYDKVKDRSFTLTAGKGVVEVYEKDGVGLIKTEKFTLNRNGTETVHVRLERRIARVVPKQPGTTEPLPGKTTGGEKPPAGPATTPSRSVENPPAKHAEKAVVTFPPITLKSILKEGHSKGVTSVAFSPDGKRLASGSMDTLNLWDVTTAHCILTFKVPYYNYLTVAFSPDGTRLATSGFGDTIVWDATTGQKTLVLKGNPSIVYCVAYSPDGKRLVCGNNDNTLTVWDTITGRKTLTLKGHASAVACVAFSPEGKRLLSGSYGTYDAKGQRTNVEVKVWDAITGNVTLTLKEKYDWGITSVAFSPDGKRLVSGSWDGTKVWDATTGQNTLTLKGVTNLVTGVAFSPDGKRLVAGTLHKTVRVWDATTGQETLTLRGHTQAVNSVAFSPDGKHLASGSNDGTVRLWNTVPRTNIFVSTLKGHTSGVTSVAFSPDGKRLVSGSSDRSVKLWDATTGQSIRTRRGHNQGVTSVAFSPDGKHMVSGSWDYSVKVWDTTTGQQTLSLDEHTAGISSVAFSPDGKRLASGAGQQSKPGEVKVWDATTGQDVLTLKGHMTSVTSVAFSRDGKRLASGSGDGMVKLWDVTTGHETLTVYGPSRNYLIAYVTLLLQKQPLAATACSSYFLTVPTVHSGAVSGVSSLAFSPDGKRLVTGDYNHMLTVWDTTTGKETLTLDEHTDAVTSVAFSPDGKRLVSGSRDKTVKVWDATTGLEILTLRGHTDAVTSVAFSPDGNRLVSGSSDGTLRQWYLE